MNEYTLCEIGVLLYDNNCDKKKSNIDIISIIYI